MKICAMTETHYIGIIPHLPLNYEFREGKMWPNDRPGLGVEINVKAARQHLNEEAIFF